MNPPVRASAAERAFVARVALLSLVDASLEAYDDEELPTPSVLLDARLLVLEDLDRELGEDALQ